MNKIGKTRYGSIADIHNNHKAAELHRATPSHAASHLARKESQISLVKNRISALCVRDQKLTNRALIADY
jgi:hypothetical protein